MDYGQIILLPNHLLQKRKNKGIFFRENARVFIIICMFALKKHMQYWARLIFFLFKKKIQLYGAL